MIAKLLLLLAAGQGVDVVKPFTEGVDFLSYRTVTIPVDQPPSPSLVLFFWTRLSGSPSGLYDLITLHSEFARGSELISETIFSLGYFKSNGSDPGDDFCFELHEKFTDSCQDVNSAVHLDSIYWTFVSIAISAKLHGKLVLKQFNEDFSELETLIKKAMFNYETLRNWKIELGSPSRGNKQSIYIQNGFIMNYYNPEMDPRFFYFYSNAENLLMNINFPQAFYGDSENKGSYVCSFGFEGLSSEGLVLTRGSLPVVFPRFALFEGKKVIENVNIFVQFSFELSDTASLQLLEFGTRGQPGFVSLSLVRRKVGGAIQSPYSLQMHILGSQSEESRFFFATFLYPQIIYSLLVGVLTSEFELTAYFLSYDDPQRDSDIQELLNFSLPKIRSNFTLFPSNELTNDERLVLRKLVVLDRPSAYFSARFKNLGIDLERGVQRATESAFECLLPHSDVSGNVCFVCPTNLVLDGALCRQYCSPPLEARVDECRPCKGPCEPQKLVYEISPQGKNALVVGLNVAPQFAASEAAFQAAFCEPSVDLPSSLYVLNITKNFENFSCQVELWPFLPLQDIVINFGFADFPYFNSNKTQLLPTSSSFRFSSLRPRRSDLGQRGLGMGIASLVAYYLGQVALLTTAVVFRNPVTFWLALRMALVSKIAVLAPALTTPRILDARPFSEILLKGISLLWNEGLALMGSSRATDPSKIRGTWTRSDRFLNNFFLIHLIQVGYLISFAGSAFLRKRECKLGKIIRLVFRREVFFWLYFYFLPENTTFACLALSSAESRYAFDAVLAGISALVALICCVVLLVFAARGAERRMTLLRAKRWGFLFSPLGLGARWRTQNALFIILVAILACLVGARAQGIVAAGAWLAMSVGWILACGLARDAWKSRLFFWLALPIDIGSLGLAAVFVADTVALAGSEGPNRADLPEIFLQILTFLFFLLPLFQTAAFFLVRRWAPQFFALCYEKVWRHNSVLLLESEKEILMTQLPSREALVLLDPPEGDELTFPLIISSKAGPLRVPGESSFSYPPIESESQLNEYYRQVKARQIQRQNAQGIMESMPIKTGFFVQPQMGSAILSPRNYILQPFREDEHLPNQGYGDTYIQEDLCEFEFRDENEEEEKLEPRSELLQESRLQTQQPLDSLQQESDFLNSRFFRARQSFLQKVRPSDA